MDKFINIILNPYVYFVAMALIIVGITQLLKLIPKFKDNNWNLSFPVVLGYASSFIWGACTKFDFTNVGFLIAYGTGITSLSTLLYSLGKKIFSKNYKITEEIKKNPIYQYLSDVFTIEMKGFKEMTTFEKYGIIVATVKSMAKVFDLAKEKKYDEAKIELKNVLSKFVDISSLGNKLDEFIEKLKNGEFNIAESEEISKVIETIEKIGEATSTEKKEI